MINVTDPRLSVAALPPWKPKTANTNSKCSATVTAMPCFRLLKPPQISRTRTGFELSFRGGALRSSRSSRAVSRIPNHHGMASVPRLRGGRSTSPGRTDRYEGNGGNVLASTITRNVSGIPSHHGRLSEGTFGSPRSASPGRAAGYSGRGANFGGFSISPTPTKRCLHQDSWTDSITHGPTSADRNTSSTVSSWR